MEFHGKDLNLGLEYDKSHYSYKIKLQNNK
jgi:hypothetical protein